MHERIYKSQAVVLRRYDFGEADKQLVAYTPHLGKISVLAKGVKRTISRKAGHLEPFTLSHLVIARGRNLDTVTSAQTVEPFALVRTDPDRLFPAMLVAELLDKLTLEREPNLALWNLFLETLRRLEEGLDPWQAATYYQLHLLQLSGYRPELARCVECEGPLDPANLHFSPTLGGLLCQASRSADAMAIRTSANAVKVLRAALGLPYENFARIVVGPPVRTEVDALLRENLRRLLDLDPASHRVIESMRRQPT